MKRNLVMVLALVIIGGATEANAQSWLRSLGNYAEDAAKRAVERNVENMVEDGVDKAFDEDTYKKKDKKEQAAETPQGWTCPSCGATGNTGKFCGECGTKQPTGDGSWTCEACGHKGNKGKFCGECGTKQGGVAQASAGETTQQPAAQPAKKAIETAYAKSDFVAGDEIIFEDNFDNEQLGEFPSQWDLRDGVAEVASVGGKKALFFEKWGTKVCPLMKEPLNYLGDVFTIEFDYLFLDDDKSATLDMHFCPVGDKYLGDGIMEYYWYSSTREDINWHWDTSMDRNSGDYELSLPANEWHHIAMSFNKRAWKVYVNGTRIVNVPNVKTPPGWFYLSIHNGDCPIYYTNFRIAKGAVPLYDRMMSDGKFITYGITFDVGKATIKPESLGEINRIVKLMTENPELKFSVEGHTDATGNAASNQTLSEQRAQAIVDKLVELGIAQERLTAVGKGQGTPIADNSTDEGRAKNRRVEFVKQ